ncbi:MAG: transporter substrate-binding domain-containing protein [Advenella sp.]
MMNMKNWLLAVTVGLSAGFGATALASDWKELKVGIEPGYAPFEYKNAAGEIEGFDADVMTEICKKMQAKCTWVEQSFDSLIPALAARKITLIHSSMQITPQREKILAFSQPIYGIPTHLMARKDSGLLPTVDSLKGKRVGALQGSTQETYAKQKWGSNGVQIVSYQDQNQTFADLAAGRIDAAIIEKPNGQSGFLSKPAGSNFAFVGPAITDDKALTGEIAIGMRKSDSKLKQAIDTALGELQQDGTITQLAGKYFKPGEIDLKNVKQ